MGLLKSCIFGYSFLSHFTSAIDSEDSAVLSLTTENFQETITKNKYVLVKWFAPWCGHCKSMASDYIKAANRVAELAKDNKFGDNKVVVAEVDATVNADLSNKYEVQGYPTIQWFLNGHKKMDYGGGRTQEAFVDFIIGNTGPALKIVTAEDAKKLQEARVYGDSLFVITGPESYQATATEIAEAPLIATSIVFVQSETTSITIYRGTNEVEEVAEDSLKQDVSELVEYLKTARRPLFGQINEDNFELYLDLAKEGLVWVCIDPKTIKEDLVKYSPIMEKAAKNQKYPFVWLDVQEFVEQAKKELGCTTYPTIVLQRGDLIGASEDSKIEKFSRSFSENPENLTLEAVNQFFADVENGTLKPEIVEETDDDLDDLDESTDEDELDGDEQEL